MIVVVGSTTRPANRADSDAEKAETDGWMATTREDKRQCRLNVSFGRVVASTKNWYEDELCEPTLLALAGERGATRHRDMETPYLQVFQNSYR